MTIGDTLAKLAENLTPAEREELRLWGNNTQNLNNFTTGLQNGGSDVFAKSLDSLSLPFFPIFSTVLSENTSSILIPIPSNANHLFCIGSGRCTGATYYEFINARFNGDTGANYDNNNLAGVNATPGASQSKGATSLTFSTFQAASATTNADGSFFSFLPHIRSPFWKSVLIFGDADEYTATDMVVAIGSGHWRSTEAITSITLFPASSTILAGSTFAVFGFR